LGAAEFRVFGAVEALQDGVRLSLGGEALYLRHKRRGPLMYQFRA
jgi:hypothetical protein